MKTTKKEARENTALQVVQLINQGVSVIGACRQVGVSRSSYYQYQKDFPEVLHTFQAELLDSTYKNLLLILVGRVELLQKVIRDGLNNSTRPTDRLAIFKEVELQLVELSQYVRIDTRGTSKETAEEVFSGPIFVPGVSKYYVEPASQSNIKQLNKG